MYNLDIDNIFDSYERLGLIYLSRMKDVTIIKDNSFYYNIGTFGGAITINSPDWRQGKQPHIIIKNNMFSKNMAYFSGNAIYIKSTLSLSGLNNKTICAGANIIDNTFVNNIGMKVHNGGAISA